jgi:hypothetical protein
MKTEAERNKALKTRTKEANYEKNLREEQIAERNEIYTGCSRMINTITVYWKSHKNVLTTTK